MGNSFGAYYILPKFINTENTLIKDKHPIKPDNDPIVVFLQILLNRIKFYLLIKDKNV